MHELAPDLIAAGSSDDQLIAYSELAAGMYDDWVRLRDADRVDWFLIGPEETMRPWPAERISELGWRIEPPPPSGLLSDGDVVDLGDRQLRVLHTPGHAAEHICLVDERAGILFAQDQVYYGPHLIYEASSDLAAFARSVRRLADELDRLDPDRLLRSLPASVGAARLPRRARRRRRGGRRRRGELSPMRGLFGEPVVGADFGHFSILVSPEARPAERRHHFPVAASNASSTRCSASGPPGGLIGVEQFSVYSAVGKISSLFGRLRVRSSRRSPGPRRPASRSSSTRRSEPGSPARTRS